MKTVAILLSSLLLAATAYANEPAAAPAKPDLSKGGELSKQVCAACHTADGSRGSPANPIIAGQHVEYLTKQLTEFKSGKRQSAVMNAMAAPLSEEDIRNVAAFYAGVSGVKPGFAKNKDTVALGQKIYRGGIAERNVPACAGCHSPNGAGIPAQYPRLAGQHTDYVELQMNNFRSGARANSPQMAAIAAKMNDKEIKAVADYVAGLR
ncbi:c-type cytochrome [Roseateles cellulosilyticus]|uniref:Cytochrome c4 n=1 Tax=Pelomonas cellulosilytica TaxID=2906762 RepID=A0ABS8XYJ3_9BURK|nr:c-type cytochrome [Pelomonas sp. P8]MCE4556368.1 cytochrome c4 [Pelomonas sp. P8]